MSGVISGRPVLKEVIDKFKTEQKQQLEEAANEILREREQIEKERDWV